MVKYSRELRIDTGLNDLGWVFAVDLRHLSVDEVTQITSRILDLRRV